MHVDAHRQIALDTRELLFERRAEIEHVAALRHRNANADRGRAVEAVLRRGRILVAARHAREVPKPHLPVTDTNGDVFERRDGIERATHAHGDAFARRFDGAGGNDGVLAGECRGQQFRRDPQTRHLTQRQVDVDDLVLHADEIHLAYVAHAQQLCADEFGLVAQLAIRETVAGQRVDHAIDIAEVVVEQRADCALRKLAADVT